MKQTRIIELAADHAAYDGHFPNFQVLPGAVLLDQALRIIAAERGIGPPSLQIASAKFLGAVRPGEGLRIEFDLDASARIRFNIFAAQRKVVSGVLDGASPAHP